MSIPIDLFKLTQKERILKLLQLRGAAGVKVFELMAPRPQGLGIAQYNARILELREESHNIVSIVPGHFVLKGYEQAPDKTKKVAKLEGNAKNTWDQLGAYLRGEGPKPDTNSAFKEVIQEALY